MEQTRDDLSEACRNGTRPAIATFESMQTLFIRSGCAKPDPKWDEPVREPKPTFYDWADAHGDYPLKAKAIPESVYRYPAKLKLSPRGSKRAGKNK